MAILLNDNLDIAAVKPTDNRYGPHATVAAAKAAISPTRRYVGLTVGIVTGGTVDEYWFKSGILDVDLVVKTITLTAGATVNTPAGTIAATDVQTAINELDTEKVAKAGDTMTGSLAITDTTVAGSAALAGSVLNLAQTWNTTGIPTALKLNVTDTASAAASALMDLQVATVSKFKVGKDGGIVFTGDSGIVSAGNIRVWSSGSASFLVRNSTNTANLFEVSGAGNVGIGVAASTYKLEVNGSFAATTKSFVIDHPTKSDMKLRYGSLEGPENGVYVRGRCRDNFIELPEYWTKLVDPLSISVSLTAIGQHQSLCVVHIENNLIEISNENVIDQSIDCFYVVYGERADVDKLVVEIPK